MTTNEKSKPQGPAVVDQREHPLSGNQHKSDPTFAAIMAGVHVWIALIFATPLAVVAFVVGPGPIMAASAIPTVCFLAFTVLPFRIKQDWRGRHI